MNMPASNELRINVSVKDNVATIHLSGYFSFNAHRDFKAAYKNKLINSQIGNIVVDLEHVEYLDSSALGMLLVLREHVQALNKSLLLDNPSAIAVRIFDIASFQKMFTIRG